MDGWERNNSHTTKQLTHEELMTTRDEIDQIDQLLVDPKNIENCESKIWWMGMKPLKHEELMATRDDTRTNWSINVGRS